MSQVWFNHRTKCCNMLSQEITSKDWGESKKRVIQKNFQPISKGTHSFRKTTLTLQQPLCIIRLFHTFFWVQHSRKILRAMGILGDQHNLQQQSDNPLKKTPRDRSNWNLGHARWESIERCKLMGRNCAGSIRESTVRGKTPLCFWKIPPPLPRISLVWA